ncbi:MAG: metallophosphoesterase [Promethearchaeota archaeon]
MSRKESYKELLTKKNVLIFLRKFLLTFLILMPPLLFIGFMGVYQTTFDDQKTPFVQWSGCNPKTEVIITWETISKEKSIVWYGTERDYLNLKEDNNDRENIHRIILSNLKPDTKYYYCVNLNEDDKSRIQSFVTAPNNTKSDFTFLMYSDSQQFYGIGWHARICNALAKHDAAFIGIAGDICQNWDYKPDWNQFFQEASVYLKDKPIVPCMGNHDGYYPEEDPDVKLHWYETYFGTTNKSADPHTFYYSFNWSNTQFVIAEIADTGDENPDDPINRRHDLWLNKTLKSGQDKDFRILIFHRQVFSAEDNNNVLIDRICPIVEKYNVSLVLYGHHHHYERFLYKGRTYICLGGGGGQQFGSNFFKPTKNTKCFSMGPSYTKISIKSDEMNIKTFSAENNLIDSCTLKKKDSIAELKA